MTAPRAPGADRARHRRAVGRGRPPPHAARRRSHPSSPRPVSPRSTGGADPLAAVLALVVALALQVGVNFANDYSDGIRGTDADRVGPLRLVGSGLARPADRPRGRVRLVRASPGVAGLVLVVLTGALVAARRRRASCSPPGTTPAAGARTATAGSARCSSSCSSAWSPCAARATCRPGTSTLALLLTGVWVGALTTAILVANNLRDLAGDAADRQADPRHPPRRPADPLLLRRPGRRGRPRPRRRRRAHHPLGAARAAPAAAARPPLPRRPLRCRGPGPDRRPQGDRESRSCSPPSSARSPWPSRLSCADRPSNPAETGVRAIRPGHCDPPGEGSEPGVGSTHVPVARKRSSVRVAGPRSQPWAATHSSS